MYHSLTFFAFQQKDRREVAGVFVWLLRLKKQKPEEIGTLIELIRLILTDGILLVKTV